MALRLGIEIPSYRRAAEAFADLTKVSLSKSALQKLVIEHGSKLAAMESVQAEGQSAPGAIERMEEEQPDPDAETMALSMDGVMVHTREENWKEVKVVAISAVEQLRSRGGQTQVHLQHHSYRAGLWDADEFSKHQWAEAWRRGIEKAKRVVSVNDGARWIWALVRTCYAPCVEIIDWWHAVEHLWEIVHLLFADDDPEAKVWADTLKTLLWNGQFSSLFREMRAKWPRGKDLPKELLRAIGYFYHNRHRMDYAAFRAAGLPVGSGTVESACKTVVQERLCQAGMRWSCQAIQAVLALRCALLSNRWNDSLDPCLLPLAVP